MWLSNTICTVHTTVFKHRTWPIRIIKRMHTSVSPVWRGVRASSTACTHLCADNNQREASSTMFCTHLTRHVRIWHATSANGILFQPRHASTYATCTYLPSNVGHWLVTGIWHVLDVESDIDQANAPLALVCAHQLDVICRGLSASARRHMILPTCIIQATLYNTGSKCKSLHALVMACAHWLAKSLVAYAHQF